MNGIGALIRDLIDKRIKKLWTATVAQVVSVDYANNLCTVTLKSTVGGNEVILEDLPIMYPSTTAGTLMMALSEGDLVMVLFGKYNIREQLASGDVTAVNEKATFSVNNGIVIPGVFSSPPYVLQEDEIVIRHSSGAGIKFSGDGAVKIVAKELDVQDMNEGYEL